MNTMTNQERNELDNVDALAAAYLAIVGSIPRAPSALSLATVKCSALMRAWSDDCGAHVDVFVWEEIEPVNVAREELISRPTVRAQ